MLMGKNETPGVLATKAQWKEWSKRFKALAKMKDRDMRKMIDWVEGQANPIEMEGIEIESGIATAEELSESIYHNLEVLTEDGSVANAIVENTPKMNGAEVWRKLLKQFDPITEQSNNSLMSEILNPQRATMKNGKSHHPTLGEEDPPADADADTEQDATRSQSEWM